MFPPQSPPASILFSQLTVSSLVPTFPCTFAVFPARSTKVTSTLNAGETVSH